MVNSNIYSNSQEFLPKFHLHIVLLCAVSRIAIAIVMSCSRRLFRRNFELKNGKYSELDYFHVTSFLNKELH